VRAEATSKTVQEQIRQNPLWKQKITSQKLNISFFFNDAATTEIYTTAHLHSNGHLLTPALKEIRRTRANRLLQWHAENGHGNILFTDEKIFTIKEQYNNQYNKIYAQTSLEVRSEGAGGHHPSYIMAWWGVSHRG
jgi:hypothetical protein